MVGLNKKVKCKLTGFIGVTVSRTDSPSGQSTFRVQSNYGERSIDGRDLEDYVEPEAPKKEVPTKNMEYEAPHPEEE